MHEIKASDIGFFMRDMLEDREVDIVGRSEGGLHGVDYVTCVDVSDPDNPVIYMGSGAQFVVNIKKR